MKRKPFVFVIVGIFVLLTDCTGKMQFQNKSSLGDEMKITTDLVQSESNSELKILSFIRNIELTNPRMEGQDILELQNRLLQLGFAEIGEADGYYGPLTEVVIKNIQMLYGFEANGKVDRSFWGFVFLDKSLWVHIDENDFGIDEKGTITSYNGNASVVVIPVKIDGVQVTGIGIEAFRDKGLRGVIIPDGIITIYGDSEDRGTFAGNQLKTIVIPDSVTYIGRNAFIDESITTVTIGANVELDDWGYLYAYTHPASFPGDFVELYNSLGKKAGTYVRKGKNWGLYEDGKLLTYELSENGFIINRSGTIIDYHSRNKELLVIPDKIAGIQITTLWENAFSEKGLTSVTIPPNIVRIGAETFIGNSLTTIVISENIELQYKNWDCDCPVCHHESFGTFFDLCYYTNMKKAGTYIYENNKWTMNGEIIIAIEETDIGTFVANGKGSVIEYSHNYWNNTEVYRIPDNIGGIAVTVIGDGIFLNSHPVNIIIPDSVTSIGNAFCGWNYDFSNLSSITIGGNVVLEEDSAGTDFYNFYNSNGKKAGTYTFSNGKWSVG